MLTTGGTRSTYDATPQQRTVRNSRSVSRSNAMDVGFTALGKGGYERVFRLDTRDSIRHVFVHLSTGLQTSTGERLLAGAQAIHEWITAMCWCMVMCCAMAQWRA